MRGFDDGSATPHGESLEASDRGDGALRPGVAPQLPSGRAPGSEQRTSTFPGRILWIVLAVYFAARVFWSLDSFAQGKAEIYKPLLPAAALLFTIAQFVPERGSLLYKLLVLASIVTFLAAAVSLVLPNA